MSSLPNPNPTPRIYQLYRWLRDPYPFLEECYLRFGKVFTLHFPGIGPAVMVADSGMVRSIFQSSSKIDLGDDNLILDPIVGTRSLLLLKGREHASLRKQLLPAFQGRCLRGIQPEVEGIVERRLVEWRDTIDVRDEMESITLEVILTLVFGSQARELFPALADAFRNLLSYIDSPLRSSLLFMPSLRKTPLGRGLKRARRHLDELLQEAIEKGRDGPLLKSFIEEATVDGVSLSPAEILDQTRTLLLAGHETTATSLTWAFYWLGRYPEWQEKIRSQEERSHFIDEALRIYPIAPIVFTRVTTDSYECGDYIFEKGTLLAPCVYLSHRDPEAFPDPATFNPDRFSRNVSPFHFYPFGGGNRRCLGASLALLEMHEILLQAVTRFHLSLESKDEVTTARRGITLIPHPAVKVKVVPRDRRTAVMNG